MPYTSIISTQELAKHLNDPDWLVIDCCFLLSDVDEKERQYLQTHIAGSIYAHLDHDLSGKIIPGVTGRHPLPAPEEAAARFSQMGIGTGVQVVAYDDQGGALAAVRLWLMLHWLGHESAAVLDGGWQKWVAEDLPCKAGKETRPAREFNLNIREGLFANLDEVERIRFNPEYRLIDVRQEERYRGEVEPIDPVAGHIPGAINLPYLENLSQNGVFRSPEELLDRYSKLLQGIPPNNIVFYCGSGVTSIHSLLAMQLSGLGLGRIYPGSWSEWITDPARPVAVGSQPV